MNTAVTAPTPGADVLAVTPPLDITDWEPIAERYRALADTSLDAANIAGWLEEWSRLSEDVGESASLVSIAYSQNTEDEARRDAYLSYIRTVGPRRAEAEQALKKHALKALGNGAMAGIEGIDLGTVIQAFRSDVELFREENVDLLAEERARAAEYGQTIGALTVDFDGTSRTLQALEPYKASQDRSVREAAWRASMVARQSVRGSLDDLFDDLLGIRSRIARNAGFENYRDYQWRAMHRFDYSAADAETFQSAILQSVVPALLRLRARRAAALGIDALRPWDLKVDPNGTEPLRPFTTGEELALGTERIFSSVDRALGERVRIMREGGLLDLDNRKGKAPGGYCATLPARRQPFIFMNAVGTDANVRTMLHEAGHAFHVFETVELPFVWQRSSPMEFAEVASMSMELLTSPYIARESGGLYSSVDALRSRIAHLERIIEFLPYMAVVDAFQHWVYANPDHDRVRRDARWLELHERYCVGASWEGLETIRSGMWQHKLHIFQVPFYYIEYGIAQLGALQVWRNSMSDPAGALKTYRSALSLGGTRDLPGLFKAAGAQLAFDVETVAGLVELVETNIDALYSELEHVR